MLLSLRCQTRRTHRGTPKESASRRMFTYLFKPTVVNECCVIVPETAMLIDQEIYSE
jgi:hypothetical protein